MSLTHNYVALLPVFVCTVLGASSATGWSLQEMEDVTKSHSEALLRMESYLRMTNHFWNWFNENERNLKSVLEREESRRNSGAREEQALWREMADMKNGFDARLSSCSSNVDLLTHDISFLMSEVKQIRAELKAVKDVEEKHATSLKTLMKYSRTISDSAADSINAFKKEAQNISVNSMEISALSKEQAELEDSLAGIETRLQMAEQLLEDMDSENLSLAVNRTRARSAEPVSSYPTKEAFDKLRQELRQLLNQSQSDPMSEVKKITDDVTRNQKDLLEIRTKDLEQIRKDLMELKIKMYKNVLPDLGDESLNDIIPQPLRSSRRENLRSMKERSIDEDFLEGSGFLEDSYSTTSSTENNEDDANLDLMLTSKKDHFPLMEEEEEASEGSGLKEDQDRGKPQEGDESENDVLPHPLTLPFRRIKERSIEDINPEGSGLKDHLSQGRWIFEEGDRSINDILPLALNSGKKNIRRIKERSIEDFLPEGSGFKEHSYESRRMAEEAVEDRVYAKESTTDPPEFPDFPGEFAILSYNPFLGPSNIDSDASNDDSLPPRMIGVPQR